MEKNLIPSEKQTIAAELFCLRAGLSIISQCADEIKQKEEVIAETKKTQEALCEQARQERQETYQSIQEELSSLKNKHSDLENRRKSAERAVSECEEAAKHSKTDVKFFWGDNEAISYHITFIFLSSFFWLGVLLLIYLIRLPIAKIKVSRESQSRLKEARLELEIALRCEEEQAPALCQKIQEFECTMNSRLAEADAKMNAAIVRAQESAKARIVPSEQHIRKAAAQAKTVNKVLQENYGVLLNESDWPNIDLIIHYLETGRADSVKEALYQVDRQHQNNRIVNAIHEATQAIGHHIEFAFDRMGQALTLCFERLDSHIQGLSAQMADSQRKMSAANSTLLSRLDEQISTSKANNALLEKANASSEKLIHDLRYSQQYW